MSSPTVNAFEAVQNAQTALQRGDKLSARRWAEMAASLAPEREEPWLLLAAVASPKASVGYLKQALKLNPDSPRAKAGLDWALKRVEAAAQSAPTARVRAAKPAGTSAQTATTVPTRIARPVAASQKPASLPEKTKKSIPSIFILLLLPILLIGVLAFSIWNASPALAVFSSQVSESNNHHVSAWAQLGLAKATSTPAPTATPIATSTPTETATPIFTETPTASPTTEASPTPLPTDTGGPAQSNRQAPEAVPVNTSGKWILVDISEQHLYAYEGETLVYSFVASTGMGNSTRVGTFRVQDKIPNAYGATWNIWMPNWLGIYYSGSLENGIHALPILSNGATLWAGYLGTPISFGCVVLGSYEEQQLYDWAEIGIPVKIQR